jgi:hypothetical protein
LDFLTLLAFKNEKEKINNEQIENIEVLNTESPNQKEQKIIFQKTLTLQNITFDISTIGEGAISQLIIQTKGLEIDSEKITFELDGLVTNTEIEDLNMVVFPEILIYTVSAGSGSYGNVIGFSVNNEKSISQIYFPEISDNKEASSGYMRQDEFAIIETTLARRFPVYKDGDTNNNPTGGNRLIEYKLKDDGVSRLFVIDKISEYWLNFLNKNYYKW